MNDETSGQNSAELMESAIIHVNPAKSRSRGYRLALECFNFKFEPSEESEHGKENCHRRR